MFSALAIVVTPPQPVWICLWFLCTYISVTRRWCKLVIQWVLCDRQQLLLTYRKPHSNQRIWRYFEAHCHLSNNLPSPTDCSKVRQEAKHPSTVLYYLLSLYPLVIYSWSLISFVSRLQLDNPVNALRFAEVITHSWICLITNKAVDNMDVFTLNRAKTQGQTNNQDIGRMTDDSRWA